MQISKINCGIYILLTDMTTVKLEILEAEDTEQKFIRRYDGRKYFAYI